LGLNLAMFLSQAIYVLGSLHLGNKAPNPNNSATRGYFLTVFAVPLLPRPQRQAFYAT
jgi:hypothetical protein